MVDLPTPLLPKMTDHGAVSSEVVADVKLRSRLSKGPMDSSRTWVILSKERKTRDSEPSVRSVSWIPRLSCRAKADTAL